MMNTITTKEAVKLVCRELGQRARQLELADLEDFERLGNPPIDSDVLPDDLMAKLLEHLEFEELLEKA
jgi:hypothetical protein